MYNVPATIQDPALFPILRQAVATTDLSPAITSAKIKLTEGCNLRCVMCNYWRSVPKGELAKDEVLRVIGEMQELGLKKVHFSGGELFLRPDAVEILCATAAHGINVNLTTNGTLLTREMARDLVRGRIHSMSFSLDGPDAKTHDRIRGHRGAFEATLRGIRHVDQERRRQDRRIYIRINTVIQKRNYLLHAEMIDLAARLGAVELRRCRWMRIRSGAKFRSQPSRSRSSTRLWRRKWPRGAPSTAFPRIPTTSTPSGKRRGKSRSARGASTPAASTGSTSASSPGCTLSSTGTGTCSCAA